MKVKDLYWAARNSTFFINLESEGRPLLCGPLVAQESQHVESKSRHAERLEID